MGDQLLYIKIITMKVHVKILIGLSDVLGGFVYYYFWFIGGGRYKARNLR